MLLAEEASVVPELAAPASPAAPAASSSCADPAGRHAVVVPAQPWRGQPVSQPRDGCAALTRRTGTGGTRRCRALFPPADQHTLRTERQRFEHVAAAAYAAVEEDGRAAADRGGRPAQQIDRGRRAVEIPSAMVRDDDGVHAFAAGALGVIRVHQPLHQESPWPALAQAREIPGLALHRARQAAAKRVCGELQWQVPRRAVIERWRGLGRQVAR